MRAARETMPATGQKAPPKSLLDVAIKLEVAETDSMTDPSTNIFGAWALERPLKASREEKASKKSGETSVGLLTGNKPRQSTTIISNIAPSTGVLKE